MAVEGEQERKSAFRSTGECVEIDSQSLTVRGKLKADGNIAKEL